ncbi:MAG TPA: GNAT family N-acetyltransferase [Candidatus Acidoferrum sp.]|nr:GNAT family N-acetyltransferase [Candidatus Acidoferrum sp.]
MELRGPRMHLRSLSDADTDLILRWRGDPGVAAQLFSEGPPSRAEHQAFLERLRETDERLEFAIVLEGGTPVGTVGLSHIDRKGGNAEYGILIGEESARGKGIARAASDVMLDHAFNVLGLHRVSLRVFADNHAAIALYRRLGFRIAAGGAAIKEKDGIPRQVLGMVIDLSERAAAAS